jgi:hypothetical protein
VDRGLHQESCNFVNEICHRQPPNLTHNEVADLLAELEPGMVEAMLMTSKHFVDMAIEQPNAFTTAQNEINKVGRTQRSPAIEEDRERLPLCQRSDHGEDAL